MYRVVIKQRAQRALNKLPRNHSRLIGSKIEDLACDPYAPNNNTTQLQGRPGYRLWVGDWRVIYELHDDELMIVVVKMGSRGDIYQ